MALTFYLGAAALFGLGALCIRKTSPYSKVGGTTYERRRTRRVIGEILLIAGALLLGLGLLSQFFSSF